MQQLEQQDEHLAHERHPLIHMKLRDRKHATLTSGTSGKKRFKNL